MDQGVGMPLVHRSRIIRDAVLGSQVAAARDLVWFKAHASDNVHSRRQQSADLSLAGSHVTFRSPILSHHWRLEERKSMKRTFAIILAAPAAAALFGGLVYAVLVAAHVSEPGATTVYGLTPRRLWATAVVVLALAGVVIGGPAPVPPASWAGTAPGPSPCTVVRGQRLAPAANGARTLA